MRFMRNSECTLIHCLYFCDDNWEKFGSYLEVKKLKPLHFELNYILGVVKRNPLFFHSISCKNNGFLFTTSNIIKILLNDGISL